MIVRHRTQYFPDGGGAIAPVGIPAALAATAYAAGVPTATRIDAGATPGYVGGGIGSGGGGDESTWGRVNPHLAQKSAPEGAL